MRITARSVKSQIPRLRRALFYQQVTRVEKAGRAIARQGRESLVKTLQYWGDSGANRFARPVPTFKVTVKRNLTSGKIDLNVHLVMNDPTTGKPSFLWHILSQGRRTYTFPAGKQSPPIKARKRRRTHSNSLNVDPFPGYSGEVFVIRGGQRVRGVAALNWYDAAAKEILSKAKHDPLLKKLVIDYEVVDATG